MNGKRRKVILFCVMMNETKDHVKDDVGNKKQLENDSYLNSINLGEIEFERSERQKWLLTMGESHF